MIETRKAPARMRYQCGAVVHAHGSDRQCRRIAAVLYLDDSTTRAAACTMHAAGVLASLQQVAP